MPTPSDKPLDEEIGRLRIVAHQPCDGRPRLGRGDLVGAGERHRMDADVLVDDELHARQPDPVIGQHRGVEGELGIAEIDHDLGARPRHRARSATRVDLER